MCVLLAFSTKRSRCETNPEIKKASEQNEAYDHQLSMEMSGNVAYKKTEHQPSHIASSIYETIN